MVRKWNLLGTVKDKNSYQWKYYRSQAHGSVEVKNSFCYPDWEKGKDDMGTGFNRITIYFQGFVFYLPTSIHPFPTRCFTLVLANDKAMFLRL